MPRKETLYARWPSVKGSGLKRVFLFSAKTSRIRVHTKGAYSAGLTGFLASCTTAAIRRSPFRGGGKHVMIEGEISFRYIFKATTPVKMF